MALIVPLRMARAMMFAVVCASVAASAVVRYSITGIVKITGKKINWLLQSDQYYAIIELVTTVNLIDGFPYLKG